MYSTIKALPVCMICLPWIAPSYHLRDSNWFSIDEILWSISVTHVNFPQNGNVRFIYKLWGVTLLIDVEVIQTALASHTSAANSTPTHVLTLFHPHNLFPHRLSSRLALEIMQSLSILILLGLYADSLVMELPNPGLENWCLALCWAECAMNCSPDSYLEANGGTFSGCPCPS